MELEGKCPKCNTPVTVEEYPSNVVFLVDGKVAHDCPNCGKTLIYAEVMGIHPDVEPTQ